MSSHRQEITKRAMLAAGGKLAFLGWLLPVAVKS